jgi:hypothetical protein
LQKCASARLRANACFTEESPRVGVIAGYRRVQAAKEIGWNMMREDMSEVEQGKVLHEIAEKCDISNVELAKKLGKSEFLVHSRIKLALNLHENVAKALEASTIGFKVTEIILV